MTLKIKELIIKTINFKDQIHFYEKLIGLKLIELNKFQASFQIGQSTLKLIESENFYPYHIAINIPCNKENEALAWLKKRVNVLKADGNEIQDFNYWNAKAIYFYDLDKNIIEFISRKNLKNESNENFNSKSLLEISEIGMPVNDIKSTYTSLNKRMKIKKFDGGFERFCAIGDEEGLFICINKNLKDWFPTGDKAHSSEFDIKFEENGNEFNLSFLNGEII